MPALVFLNRKWLIASDDLVIPCLAEAFLRIVWLTAGLIVMIFESSSCHESQLGDYFMHSCIGDLIGTSCLSIAISFVSSKGSVLEEEKRNFIGKLLYIKLITVLADCTIAFFGIWLFMENFCTEKEIFIKVTTVCAWIYIFIFGISTGICYDSLGSAKYWKTKSNMNSSNFFHKAEHIWKKRLKYLCCCANVPEEDSLYIDISRFLASLLNDTDLTSTDILAGLITLDRKYFMQMQKQNFYDISLYKKESIENCAIVPEWMNPENALYFLKIAKSTYGWFALCNTFHPCSFCTLSFPLKCCRQDNEKVRDNCCHYNFTAVQKITGLSDSDILYASFGNSSEEPAFYVAVDHKKKYIIIAVRGTRSFSDLLTVINAEIQDFPSVGTSSSFKCHRGILHSALFLEKKLNDLNVLKVALAENPSYAIGITGHCLGGSIAAVLGLLLHPKYPNLQCFIYAPLAVLSVEMIPNTLDFIFTTVVGDDIVPCLCANTCKKLLAVILRSLEETKIPKYKILMRGFWKYIVKYGKGTEKRSQKICDNTQNKIDVEITTTHTEERTASNDVQLYAPGRILYFEKGDKWKAHWLTGLNISNLFMSPAMRCHHQPYTIQCMLEMYKEGLKD